jgi:lipopolysaccharide export system protein LptA
MRLHPGQALKLGPLLLGLLALLTLAHPAAAQPLDLAHGGPIGVTASDGLEWRQNEQVVIARGNAKAVRGDVTVTADRLIAYYRKKAAPPGTAAAAPATPPAAPAQPQIGLASDTDTSGNEVYRLVAEGNVHIFTPTDQAWGDRATYDMDQAVLLLVGRNLKLVTPNDVLTARDSMEYWSQKHMAVARGNAVVVTNDGRRLAADTLVAYTTEADQPHATQAAAKPADTQAAANPANPQDPLAASGKLQKMDAFGHVSIRTPTDTAIGDRAVYVPDTGIARLAGNVQITRGQNQLNGTEAEVNMKTGISRLLAGDAGRVQGLVMPNDASSQNLAGPPGGELPSANKPTQPPPGASK